MDRMPVEIYGEVCRYLDLRSLSQLSSCCKIQRDIALPTLYKEMRIHVNSLGADPSSLRFMRTLTEVPQIRRFLRHIVVSGGGESIWTANSYVEHLCVALAGLFRGSPKLALQSFVWRLPIHKKLDVGILRHLPPELACLAVDQALIDKSVQFSALHELSCTQLSSLSDVAWVRKQVQRNRLRKLLLGLAPFAHRCVHLRSITHLLHMIGPSQHARDLTHLELTKFDLSQWPMQEITNLAQLTLQNCTSVGLALQSLVDHNPTCTALRVLSLTVPYEQVSFAECLHKLGRTAPLTDLCILTGGRQQPLPVASILAFRASLEHLVLESREQAWDASSVLLYPPRSFEVVITSFSKLKSLGMPVKLDQASRAFWVRIS